MSIRFAMLLTVLLCGISLTVQSAPPLNFSLPNNASQVAKGIYDLGRVRMDGKVLQGYAFLHPSVNAAKPEGGSKGGGKGKGGNTSGSTCYSFIGNEAGWKVAEDYILNSNNLSNLSDADVAQAISTATVLWNNEVASPIFGTRVSGSIDGADTQSPDGKNEVYFAGISEPGTIAVTTTWGVFSGPKRFREIVEWDQVYDDTDFAWGDADTNTGVMDLLNIAAHEVGHAAGMGHPDNTDGTCGDETMHAFAITGETKKRDLNEGDKAGIKKLY